MPIGTVYKAPPARTPKLPRASYASSSTAARSVSSLSADAVGSAANSSAAPYDQRSHLEDLSVDSASEADLDYQDESAKSVAEHGRQPPSPRAGERASLTSDIASEPSAAYTVQQNARLQPRPYQRHEGSQTRVQESARRDMFSKQQESLPRQYEPPVRPASRNSSSRSSRSNYNDANTSEGSVVQPPDNAETSRAGHPRVLPRSHSNAPALSFQSGQLESNAIHQPPKSPSLRGAEASPLAPFFGRPVTKRPCKIMVLYYSTYGHIKTMADSVATGINSVEGARAVLYQVPETLSEERLRKMNAPPRPSDPVLEYDEMNVVLQEISGIMFGIPTRFGMMPAQMKAWFDSTSKLWTKGHLVGKPAGCFFSTAVQSGGQETTALTTVTQLTHHGMLFVPPGYSFGGRMFDNTEVHGGSPYGAGCIAGGDGSRLPSKFELDFARHQGAQFATIALKLAS